MIEKSRKDSLQLVIPFTLILTSHSPHNNVLTTKISTF